MKRRLFCVLIALFCLVAPLSACKSAPIPKRNGLAVSVLSVGQGDAVLITLPEGVVLIDGGGDAEFQKPFLSAVTGGGIDTLDYLIVTHPERDHTAFLPALLESVSVKTAYLPLIEKSETFVSFTKTAALLKERECTVRITALYDTFMVGEARFVVLSPSSADDPHGEYAAYARKETDTTNDLSAVVYMEYRDYRFLFAGDASAAIEEKILARWESGLYHPFDVDLNGIHFLKVAHHGSADASSSDFLSLLKPTYAVVSVGAANSYGHPKDVTLSRLLDCGATVYRTDFFGTVTASVTENGLEIINAFQAQNG